MDNCFYKDKEDKLTWSDCSNQGLITASSMLQLTVLELAISFRFNAIGFGQLCQ